MATNDLGELVRVDIREQWPSEPSDFTPWLAGNIEKLGQAIGISLEVIETEKAVGTFSADILARDENDDRMVVIENQFGLTDHDHLGKTLTYAAGLDAKAIVWVTEKFRSEHLAALGWLNSLAGKEAAFFGVEVQLWRIGNSALAPMFEVVSKPNDWENTVKEQVTHAKLTPGQQQQINYWQAYAKFLETQTIPFKTSTPGARNWYLHTMGEGNVYLTAVASTSNSETNKYDGGEIRAEMVLNEPETKQLVADLEVEKAQIEKELGQPLVWHNPEDSIMSRLYVRKSVDISDREDWPNQHAWLREHLEGMYNTLKPRVTIARQKVKDLAAK